MDAGAEKKSKNRKRFYSMLRICLYISAALVIGRFFLPLLVFYPAKKITSTPTVVGLPFEEVSLTTGDGVAINGWFVPAANPRGTLLFFHGNAGNLSNRIDSIAIFHSLRLSVFIIDYRGYGKSEGKPTIPGVGLDARAAWKWLTEEKKIPAERIVVFGRSLGGAVAMELMREAVPRALILESTFSSLPEMVRIDFLSPVARFLIGDVWNSARAARALTVPTLCIHSPDDEIVPYKLGKRLYEAVGSDDKSFFEIRGDHNEGFLTSYDAYCNALNAFVTRHFGK